MQKNKTTTKQWLIHCSILLLWTNYVVALFSVWQICIIIERHLLSHYSLFFFTPHNLFFFPYLPPIKSFLDTRSFNTEPVSKLMTVFRFLSTVAEVCLSRRSNSWYFFSCFSRRFFACFRRAAWLSFSSFCISAVSSPWLAILRGQTPETGKGGKSKTLMQISTTEESKYSSLPTVCMYGPHL